MNPPHLMGWYVVVLVRWWYAVRLYHPNSGHWDFERLLYLCRNLKNQSKNTAERAVSAFSYTFYPECSAFDPTSAAKTETKNNLT